jgi:hypothetical protein
VDRELLEPDRALGQRLQRLTAGLAETRNRQRWQGAIQKTTTEGGGGALTNNTEVVVSSLTVEPGRWFIMARAGIQISSTPGGPEYTGSESFFVDLRAYDLATQVFLEELDSDFWAPAVLSEPWTGGFYAASAVLFGTGSWESPISIQVVGRADDTGSADHIIPWRGGKIIALPF